MDAHSPVLTLPLHVRRTEHCTVIFSNNYRYTARLRLSIANDDASDGGDDDGDGRGGDDIDNTDSSTQAGGGDEGDHGNK